MKNTHVVRMDLVRDMLATREGVRQEILSGDAAGAVFIIARADGRLDVRLGGTLKEDPSAALKAVLKMQMAHELDAAQPASLRVGT